MDAFLAVSTLTMASAVAWADWVMHCYGIGSEAMSQVLGGLIMVKLGKTGEGHKRAYISGTISLIYFKLGQDVGVGVPHH